jgi:aminopeptidase YwaD
MNSESLTSKASRYLQELCVKISSRRVGSQGNQDATAFFKNVLQKFNFRGESQPFACIDLRLGEIHLSAGGQDFEAFISPYTLACDVKAELVVAATVDELVAADARGKILLLRGEIAKEQLMPKNFVFYNPEEHQRIYRLLEEKKPAAVISATTRNPELAGAVYPFPMFEDGDFDIPSAYMTDAEGEKLASFAGSLVSLKMDAERIPSTAENISAIKGNTADKRIVVCAHIDAKAGSPGAVDNGGGTVVLMLLAEMLGEYQGEGTIEILALNGEDYYSVGGQMEYLRKHQGRMDQINLAINLDGVGFTGHPTGLSFYDCPDKYQRDALVTMGKHSGIEVMQPWFQGDHMVFVMNSVPAMALITTGFMQMETEIAHTLKDNVDMVDVKLLVEVAQFLFETITSLNNCG